MVFLKVILNAPGPSKCVSNITVQFFLCTRSYLILDPSLKIALVKNVYYKKLLVFSNSFSIKLFFFNGGSFIETLARS